MAINTETLNWKLLIRSDFMFEDIYLVVTVNFD